MSSTKILEIKTVCSSHVKHVQIKPPTNLIISGGWLRRIEREWPRDTTSAKKRIKRLTASGTNAVQNARDGKKKVSFAKIVPAKTD